MAGIYVHIPFCKSRCIYCGFYSTTHLSCQDEYIKALVKELHQRRNYLKKDKIDTIYIGGGTPSTLSYKNIALLCNTLMNFAGHSITEFTMECNPDDITVDFANSIYSLGINRVSMGVQTFSEKRLSFLRRRHGALDAERAVNILKESGISNISIDLMFGFPDETLDDWKKDLAKAIELNVNHISAYSLMYEEGTHLYNMLQDNAIKEIDEELSCTMYDTLIDSLTNVGYEHYEISNFAKKGFRSIHNSNYWKETPYLGLGTGAHSYNIVSRQWNVSNLQLYLKAINEENNNYIEDIEILNEADKYNDLITTALRTIEGINLSSLSIQHKKHLIISAKKDLSNGNLMITNDHIHLTRKGLFISDDVMSNLIIV